MPHTRLFIDHPLSPGALVALDTQRAHYLLNVMRKKAGDMIAVFNGEAGEWLAEIEQPGKRNVSLAIRSQIAPQRQTPDVWLAFALIKNKSEIVVEKAVELGVSKILPLVTQHAVVKHANLAKLQAHAIEAAEQCERSDVPAITSYDTLAKLLGDWPGDRVLLYGDETGTGESLANVIAANHKAKFGVLIGPEGGWSEDELRMLQLAKNAKAFGMGPRILRADTAAVAALACVVSATGEWEQKPHFKGQGA